MQLDWLFVQPNFHFYLFAHAGDLFMPDEFIEKDSVLCLCIIDSFVWFLFSSFDNPVKWNNKVTSSTFDTVLKNV